jgi:tRNA pseudouridine38-40 synthase
MPAQPQQKIALGVEYLGSRYHGFQSQKPGIDTVQAHLERALSIVADQQVSVICAGRTDTGVHARGQVIHFLAATSRPEKAWVFGTNSHLPGDISIKWAKQVPEGFHARFSATARQYLYVVYNNNVRSALFDSYTTLEHRPLDEQRMAEAGLFLLGENDFSSFRASGCQSKTAMRNIKFLKVARKGDFVIVDICANAFLHHMVRNIAGLLLDIGAGVGTPEDARRVLKARDRSKAGVTAPPNGLYLNYIEYPSTFNLPNVKSAGKLTGFLD